MGTHLVGSEPRGHVCPDACQGQGDKDPVQKSHGQKKVHGQQRKSAPSIVHRPGIAPPPHTGTAVLGTPRSPSQEVLPWFSPSFSLCLQRGFLHVGWEMHCSLLIAHPGWELFLVCKYNV